MSKIALCCGINDYPGVGSDLAGCANDCLDWSAALEARGYTVTQLLDNEATSTNIVSKLKGMITTAKYGDVVLFQFSGHGSFVPDDSGDESDGRDEVLCCHDIEQGAWLDDDTLGEIFSERERGVRVVFVADSCHSGSVSRMSTKLAPQPHANKVRFLPPATFMEERELTDVRGIGARRVKVSASSASLLLGACADHQVAWDAYFGDRPNGAFSRCALDALAALPAKGTYFDWWRAIRAMLPSQSYPQSPTLLAPGFQKRWPVLSEGR